MLHHPHTDHPRLRALTAGIVFAVLSCSPSVTLGAQAPDAGPTVETERHCRLTVELAPSTGRIEGVAVFEAPDVPRFLGSTGGLPIALDARLVLEHATAAGVSLAVERIGEDEATDSRNGPWPSRPTLSRHRSSCAGRASCATTFAPVKRRGASTTPGCARTWGGGRLSLTRRSLASAPRLGTVPGLEWTRRAALQLDARGHVADDAGGQRRSGFPRRELDEPSSAASWSTPFPQTAIAVAGGQLSAFAREHGPVVIRALLHPGSSAHAPRLLDAVASYLDLYQPLLGAYPFREFTVVENFFSSGFASPGFTLLSSQVVDTGERGLRPGYLDHELLHNWWGNGVLASRRSGHWAEALATYCANYMRPVLEGRSEQGRVHAAPWRRR